MLSGRVINGNERTLEANAVIIRAGRCTLGDNTVAAFPVGRLDGSVDEGRQPEIHVSLSYLQCTVRHRLTSQTTGYPW